MKILRTDNEFLATAIRAWCAQEHILLLPSLPHRHNKTRRIERFHRSTQDLMVKQLAHKSHLDARFWALSWLNAVELRNLFPRARLHGKSPAEVWFDRPYDLAKRPTIPFGSIVMSHIPLPQQTTMSGRAIEGIVVGNSPHHEFGLRIFNPTTKRESIRHTYKILGETEPISPTYVLDDLNNSHLLSMPETSSLSSSSLSQESASDVSPVPPATRLYEFTYTTLRKREAPSEILQYFEKINSIFFDTGTSTNYKITGICEMTSENFEAEYVFQFYDTARYDACPVDPDQTEFEPCNQLLADTSYVFPSSAQTRSRAPTPISRRTRRLNMLKTAKTYTYDPDKPVTIAQALRSPHAAEFWQALLTEIERLIAMGTFEAYLGPLSDIDPGALLSSKAIFELVYNPDGTFKKFKCRIVARGDMLKTSKTTDLYAGTVRSDSMRLFYSIIAQEDLDIMSIDVKTAFLYPALPDDEVIYMRRPKGMTDAQMPAVVRLRKCLYGLPAASRYFNEHLSKTLLAQNFKRLISDPQMYIKWVGSKKIIASTHVDDLLVAASKGSSLLLDTQVDLATTYDITVTLDPVNHLGLVVTRDRKLKSLTLTQPAYIEEMLTKFHITTPEKPPVYPMHTDYLTSQPLDLSPLTDESSQTLFQQKVGCLMYLMSQTRPDLHYPVTQLSRRSFKATSRDMQSVDRVLAYVAATKSHGITFCTYGEPFDLHVWCDVSYNSYPTSSKSHTEVSLHLGRSSAAFMTISKKQSIIADSSTVAEFIGTHAAVKAILWTRNLLTELGYPPSTPTTLYQDNESTINMIYHKGNAGRSKHIALRYNIIREYVADGTIKVVYCPTSQMIADTLTKPLGKSLFSQHQNRLLNLTHPSS